MHCTVLFMLEFRTKITFPQVVLHQTLAPGPRCAGLRWRRRSSPPWPRDIPDFSPIKHWTPERLTSSPVHSLPDKFLGLSPSDVVSKFSEEEQLEYTLHLSLQTAAITTYWVQLQRGRTRRASTSTSSRAWSATTARVPPVGTMWPTSSGIGFNLPKMSNVD